MAGTKDTSASEILPEDTIKILIATDCHLGYEESSKRASQRNDSFITFEEILQYGKQNQVDFVLLGGDLFHETKPSQSTMIKCTELLRKYCLGPGEVKVQFLTDPEVIFQHCAFKTVNYEDPDINICMPVFSIHGNHDDPSHGSVGVMDWLSTSGLINYFGKCTDLDQITVPPLLLQKGNSRIAIYGLSYINDRRLCRLLKDGKVKLLKTDKSADTFNILVLHQNRVRHEAQSHIPEHKLPNFLNLILWGHEHECRIKPEFCQEGDYFISQPGSSVATSLCEAESVRKYAGILSINKMRFTIKKLKLKTVRPFVFDNLVLSTCDDIPRDSSRPLKDVMFDYVDHYIEDKLLAQATKLLTGHSEQPIIPLIRLRIFYSNDQERFDESRLAQKYCDEVCNPINMILFRKGKPASDRSRSKGNMSSTNYDADEMSEVFGHTDAQDNWNESVQGGLKKFFDSDEHKDSLLVFLASEMNEALTRFVEKDDVDAFKDLARYRLQKTAEYLKEQKVTPTVKCIHDAIVKLRDTRREMEQKEQEDVQKMFADASRRKDSIIGVKDYANGDDIVILDDEGGREVKRKKVASSRGGRGSRGGKKLADISTRGRGTAGSISKVAAQGQKKITSNSFLTPRPPVVPRGRTQAGPSGFGSQSRLASIVTQSRTTSSCSFIDESDSE